MNKNNSPTRTKGEVYPGSPQGSPLKQPRDLNYKQVDASPLKVGDKTKILGQPLEIIQGKFFRKSQTDQFLIRQGILNKLVILSAALSEFRI